MLTVALDNSNSSGVYELSVFSVTVHQSFNVLIATNISKTTVILATC